MADGNTHYSANARRLAVKLRGKAQRNLAETKARSRAESTQTEDTVTVPRSILERVMHNDSELDEHIALKQLQDIIDGKPEIVSIREALEDILENSDLLSSFERFEERATVYRAVKLLQELKAADDC